MGACLYVVEAPRPLPPGHRGRDRMVVGFTTTCAMSAHHH